VKRTNDVTQRMGEIWKTFLEECICHEFNFIGFRHENVFCLIAIAYQEYSPKKVNAISHNPDMELRRGVICPRLSHRSSGVKKVQRTFIEEMDMGRISRCIGGIVVWDPNQYPTIGLGDTINLLQGFHHGRKVFQYVYKNYVIKLLIYKRPREFRKIMYDVNPRQCNMINVHMVRQYDRSTAKVES